MSIYYVGPVNAVGPIDAVGPVTNTVLGVRQHPAVFNATFRMKEKFAEVVVSAFLA